MDMRFQANNTHLEGKKSFKKLDINLRRLNTEPLVFKSELIELLPRTVPGIYTLSGGRQVGKTTLLKQWMASLLDEGVDPKSIFFFSGEMIDDHHALYRLVKAQIDAMRLEGTKFILIDEISYIREWDKAVKYLADTGELESVVLLLTGSDIVFIEAARQRFPGRRGKADKVDFHYYPLSFKEYVDLKTGKKNGPEEYNAYINNYLVHGGFMTAINDFEKHNRISVATLSTYSDWIRGDVRKRNKQEHYLHDIISGIIKHYGSQISWDTLAKELTINHTSTIADYINLLQGMDACFIQHALIEDKLSAAPKKRKKVIFNDPFIYHAMRHWLDSIESAYEDQIAPILTDYHLQAKLIESVVVSHFKRYAPTYYIKSEGEVDVAYVYNQKFWPVEVKWGNQQRPKDLKQISKYDNGVIYAKTRQATEINGVPVKPLGEALYRIQENFIKGI